MNKILVGRFLLVFLIVGGATLGIADGARAASSWIVSTQVEPYRSGPFDSPESAADDIVAEYGRLRGGLNEDWKGCPSDFSPVHTGFDNQSTGLSIREQDGYGGWGGCFASSFYITEKVCAVGQQSQWLVGGATICKDTAPLVCQNGTSSDGTACTTACPADPFAGMCSAPAPAAINSGPTCPACDQTPPSLVYNTPLPIRHATGWKYLQEAVVRIPSLDLALTYNSVPLNLLPRTLHPFGNGWSSNYGMRVWPIANGVAVSLRPDGKFFQFTPPASGNVYASAADVPDTLTKILSGSTITGWQYKRARDEAIEQYDADGILISVSARNGQVTALNYSTASTPTSIAPRAGLLITVADHFGRNLQLTYDGSARINSATDPLGNVFSFYYDEASSFVVSGQPLGNNLTSIEFPGLHKRVFYYNEQLNTAGTNRPNVLTGITDENASRYATYQYDTAGRAVHEEHAGGVDGYSVSYNADATSTVTDPLSTAHAFGYQTVQRVTKTTSITGPACPSCGPAALSYDRNGFQSSITDWNGIISICHYFFIPFLSKVCFSFVFKIFFFKIKI